MESSGTVGVVEVANVGGTSMSSLQAGVSSSDPSSCQDYTRTVYVGNLHPDVNSDMLYSLFTGFGKLVSWKLTRDRSKDLIAFIEYEDHKGAELAITAMSGRSVMGQKIKVNWATSSPISGKQSTGLDVSRYYTIFVGDVDQQMMEDELEGYFAKFGKILKTVIKRDPATKRSKGYGFITFEESNAASKAVEEMNDTWMKSRIIRVGWASNNPTKTVQQQSSNVASYDDIANAASISNTTVFCGNLKNCISDQLLVKEFKSFGGIIQVRSFPDKGFGFIKFMNRVSAVQAILHMNGRSINGEVAKVAWGKEAASSEPTYGYYGNPYGASWSPNLNNSYNYSYQGYETAAGANYAYNAQLQSSTSSNQQQQLYQSLTYQGNQWQYPQYGYGVVLPPPQTSTQPQRSSAPNRSLPNPGSHYKRNAAQ